MNSIPKYIHYCWFGNAEIPKSNQRYIEKWKKIFPDYKFILWNEDNFPVNEFVYAKEALEAGKYAFVSDVARVYALNKMGGIYLDTDVEVIRSPEILFDNKETILGWEGTISKTMGTGFIASVPNSRICNEMISYYTLHHFKADDGSLDTKSNTKILADIVYRLFNLEPSDDIQTLDSIVIYPRKYFTAYNTKTRTPEVSSDTFCIHHFDASWFGTGKKIKNRLTAVFNRFLKYFGIQYSNRKFKKL